MRSPFRKGVNNESTFSFRSEASKGALDFLEYGDWAKNNELAHIDTKNGITAELYDIEKKERVVNDLPVGIVELTALMKN